MSISPIKSRIESEYEKSGLEICYWDCPMKTGNVIERRAMEELRSGFKCISPVIHNFSGVRVLYCTIGESFDVSEPLDNNLSDYVFVEWNSSVYWHEVVGFEYTEDVVEYLGIFFKLHIYKRSTKRQKR